MKKSIPVTQLQFGMYVAELDRPWTDTPFMFQGFVLSTPEQLEALKAYCKHVFVDPERSEQLPDARSHGPKATPAPTTVEKEFPQARALHTRNEEVVRDLLGTVRAGRTLDAERIEQAVLSMTDSVLRNPDALLLFSQLREKGEYTQSHAIDVAVYMIAFGRFLQMDREDIALLGYLGMLQDIGKVKLPNELIEKRERLSIEEFERAKQHVRDSVEILRATPGLPPKVAELAALHHERQDGSGYPNGLRGKEIGMIGSIAGIVDTFDALTARRPYAEPVAPSAALSMLYKWRGAFFDTVLVEQFIRCIGIFPVGSTVELNSGEVGIVIAQNLSKRLQPRVMVIRGSDGNPLRPQKLLDLSRAPKIPSGEAYRIKRTLEFGRIQTSAEQLFMT
jgi:HD-GYP domain-containing protein (c-di-GMP phosphodiesterase class II)